MRQQQRIGVLSMLLGGFYYGGLLTGIQRATAEDNVQIVVVQTSDEALPRSSYALSRQSLPPASEHVDGWICILTSAHPDTLRLIRRAGKPLVLLSETLPDLNCPSILPDNRSGAAAAVHHLIEHGHTRIGFVGCFEQQDIRERHAGYEQALREHGIEPDPALVFQTETQVMAGGQSAARQLIEAGMPCSAVFVGTDLNAIGLMHALQDAGYELPDDLAVIGFDDAPEAEHVTPPLTSVRQRVDTLGEQAAITLLKLINSPGEAAGTIIYVPTTLIRRQSCGCNSIETQGAGYGEAAQITPRFKAQLSTALVDHLLAGATRGPTPEQSWPGVQVLVEGLVAVIENQRGPTAAQMQKAWSQAAQLTAKVQSLHGAVRLLQQAGQQLLAARQASTNEQERLDLFVEATHEMVANVRIALETGRNRDLEQALQYTYEVVFRIVDADPSEVKQLDWLQQTPIEKGCLALWQDDPDRPDANLTLDIAGFYSDTPGERVAQQSISQVAFPPTAMLSSAQQRTNMITIIPLKTNQRHWGLLALSGPPELVYIAGRETSAQWARLLALGLAREALLRSIEDQQYSLVSQQATLKLAYERERALADMVRELGSPIIPLLPGVLLVPLVGAIDTVRAEQFIGDILEGIVAHSADIVLVDITGVPLVDTSVANTLLQATRSATLLGTRVILVGVRPEIAQTIVGLGLNLGHIETQPTLAKALEMLM